MRRVLAVAVCALAACGPPTGECGGSKCAASQRCDWSNAECVEDLAPKLVVSAPVDASAVTANPLPLSGTASDDDGVPKVEYSFDGKTWNAVKVADDGTFAEQMALPPLDGAPLRLTVRATDVRGQVTTQVVGLSVDDVAPSCALLSPTDGEVFTHGAVAVRYAASGYRTLELTLDGASVTPDVADGEASFSRAVGIEDWVVHTLRLALTDAAGNTCLLQSTFIVDDVPPVLSFDSPLDGQVFGPDDYGIAFANGPATDGSGVVDVFVDVDNGNGLIQSGVWGDHWIVGRDPPAGEDYVPHYARAIGVDLAGNSTGIDVTWFADVVPPRLMITSPGPGQTLNASQLQGDDVLVSWTVADGDPQLVVTSSQAPGQNFVLPADSFGLATSPSDDGTPYMVQLSAATRTGVTTGTVSFTVDRIGPQVVSATPPLGSRMVDGPVTLVFSEPTNAPVVPFGSWSTDGSTLTLDYSSVGDQVFTAVPPGLTDALGNPGVMPSQNSMRTKPKYWPGDGGEYFHGVPSWPVPLIGVPGAYSVAAASDREGVLRFALATPTGVLTYWVNPSTGVLEATEAFDGVVAQQMEASSVLSSSAMPSDPRISGLSIDDGVSKWSVVWRDSVVSGLDGGWLVPSLGFLGEGSGLGTFGLLEGVAPTNYERGSNSQPIPLSNLTDVTSSSTHWIVSDADGGTWATFMCDGGVCGFFQVGTVNDAVAGTLSVSAGGACDAIMYASRQSGFETIEAFPSTGCPLSGCPAPVPYPVVWAQPLMVLFDPGDEARFMEVFGTYGADQLYWRIQATDPDAGCSFDQVQWLSASTIDTKQIQVAPFWIHGRAASLILDDGGTTWIFSPYGSYP